MRHWFAIYCRPRQELRALENLQWQGYNAFYPRLRILRQRKDGLTPVIESLFPRYLFIQLDDVVDNWAPIRSTRGVVEIVRSAGRPLPVPENVIAQIWVNLSEEFHCLDLTGNSDFQPGEQVTIVGSPLRGNCAEFCARKGADRVVVLLKVMHSEQKVVLPASAISRV